MRERVALRDGRELKIEVLRTVPEGRATDILEFLGHKGRPYLRHFQDYFDHGSRGAIEGLEWRFYLGSHEGKLIGNICTWEYRGLGILGHVFTHPAWRRRGVANHLLEFQDSDFRMRGGRVMVLGFGKDPRPRRLYQLHGFEDVPDCPGAMVRARTESLVDRLFRGKSVRLSALSWRHWPSACLLFLMAHPAYVRCAGLDVYGPRLVEGPIVHHFPALWSLPPRYRDRVEVLETRAGTCVAWASQMRDPNWGGTSKRRVFDLFFHPRFRKQAERLVERFVLPRGTVAYSTPEDPKNEILEEAGFRELASLKNCLSGGETLLILER
ncbi:MAG: hypothetical protein GHCLOJNM_02499 [bacterium]|nr:hypothetical protein [bacterium]